MIRVKANKTRPIDEPINYSPAHPPVRYMRLSWETRADQPHDFVVLTTTFGPVVVCAPTPVLMRCFEEEYLARRSAYKIPMMNINLRGLFLACPVSSLELSAQLMRLARGHLARRSWLPRIHQWAGPSRLLINGMCTGVGTVPDGGIAATTTAGPAMFGVYSAGVEMPFTSRLRIENPEKLPVSQASFGLQYTVKNLRSCSATNTPTPSRNSTLFGSRSMRAVAVFSTLSPRKVAAHWVWV